MIKEKCATILFRSTLPVVVASTGRAGSTMLFNALCQGFVRSHYNVDPSSVLGSFVLKLVSAYSNRLSDVEKVPYPVQKTHALYQPRYRHSARYIFVYGDPLESAQSVDLMTKKNGVAWFSEHLYHLEASGDLCDLFRKDILRYEDQLRKWGGAPKDSVFAVSYEDLWVKKSEIAQFVGFEFDLPERRPRTPKKEPKEYNVELFQTLRELPTQLIND